MRLYKKLLNEITVQVKNPKSGRWYKIVNGEKIIGGKKTPYKNIWIIPAGEYREKV